MPHATLHAIWQGVVQIPRGVLPLWAMAIVDAVSAGFFLTYWNSQWERWARPFAATMAVGALFWSTMGLWLGAATPQAAAYWYPWFLALALALESAITDALVVLLALPPWLRLGWGWVGLAAGLAALAGIFVHPQAMGLAPSGLWALPPAGTLLWGLKDLADAWPLFWVGLAVWRWARGPVPPRFYYYGLAAVVAAVSTWYDGRWVLSHPGPYPTLWLGGVFWSLILWVEIKSHAEHTYRQLRFDSMTGALTRSWGEIYLQRILNERPLGAVYGDIDYFKQINDRHGHLIGDLVLRDLVGRIRPVIRRQDVVVRLSGDEFLVAFPDASPEHGPELLARVEEALIAPPFWVPGGDPEHPEPVAVSLGWAWAPAGSALTELVRAADRAMYETKALHHRQRLEEA
ncbi:MAG: GGDEF domain-containing protein [Firmicutes bacterium]|nr:GGDEF domain-containing protein [Bacillota bacterium]